MSTNSCIHRQSAPSRHHLRHHHTIICFSQKSASSCYHEFFSAQTSAYMGNHFHHHHRHHYATMCFFQQKHLHRSAIITIVIIIAITMPPLIVIRSQLYLVQVRARRLTVVAPEWSLHRTAERLSSIRTRPAQEWRIPSSTRAAQDRAETNHGNPRCIECAMAGARCSDQCVDNKVVGRVRKYLGISVGFDSCVCVQSFGSEAGYHRGLA